MRSARKIDKALVAAVMAGLLCGAMGLLQPIDDLLRGLRNMTHMQAPSGSIVVLTIDTESQRTEGTWPWPRARIANLVERIDEAEAQRIYFSQVFEGEHESDAILAAAFARLPQRPVISQSFDIDSRSGKPRAIQPSPVLAKAADVAGASLFFDAWSRVWKVPLAYRVDGIAYPGLASALAGRLGSDEADARIDLSIDAEAIPTIKASDILAGRETSRLAGKRVLVSSAERVMPMQGGNYPRSFAYVLGAETLLAGNPLDFGWLQPLALASLLAGLLLLGSRRTAIASIAVSAAAMGILPFVLDSRLIFISYCPAAATLLIAFAARIWRSYRRRDATSHAVTGLPNLQAFKARPEQAAAVIVARIVNYAELVNAVPMMESELLHEIARRLSLGAESSLHHGDNGVFAWTASRLETQEIGDHLDALHSFFAKPVSVGHVQVDATLVFGIDTNGDDNLSRRLAGALVAADQAQLAGQRWQFYDAARQDEMEWNVSMLGRLDQAIEEGEVWVAFQPKLDLDTMQVSGAEALARWTHPERGVISPESFVTAAEQAGRIDRLTYFVLDRALEFAAEARKRGHDLEVAVNLSTKMADHRDLARNVRAALRRFGVPPEKLTLEVTETGAANSADNLTQTVAALRAIGVQVSIDDYGTGHSTLEYLKTLQASELKIDRSFVTALDQNRSDAVLVRATIQLAHQLGLKVVAEGVETQAVLEMLVSLGCDRAQGYHIGRPMAAGDLFAALPEITQRKAA